VLSKYIVFWYRDDNILTVHEDVLAFSEENAKEIVGELAFEGFRAEAWPCDNIQRTVKRSEKEKKNVKIR
jgi:hypothetical protein